MAAAHNPQSTPPDRLDRIEEALAFTDRTTEQLSEEIAALNKAMRDLTRRMAALEDRLGKALEKPPESDEK